MMDYYTRGLRDKVNEMFLFMLPLSYCYQQAQIVANRFIQFSNLNEAIKSDLDEVMITAIERAARQIPYPPVPLATFGQATSRVVAMTILFDALAEKSPSAASSARVRSAFENAAAHLVGMPNRLIVTAQEDLASRLAKMNTANT